MKEVILHIGLHKTGTKFFQHKVFPNLPTSFVYNPPLLTQYITDLCRCDGEDAEMIFSGIESETKKISDEKTLVISREIMSGDLFSFYTKASHDIAVRLKTAFPSANILLSFRYQPDWLVSCYREYIHEHNYQSIGYFLGLEAGKDGKKRECHFSDLNYDEIIDRFIKLFGEENVNVHFFEDLKSDKLSAVENVAGLFDLAELPITEDNDKQPNRGYSALAIRLSLLRATFFGWIGLDGLLVHRPIKFFGKGGIPAGTQEMSLLPKEPYWSDSFLRDNEEVRSKNYPNLSALEVFRREFAWRNFIKERIDKIAYIDWDLLSSNRSDVEILFRVKNRDLLKSYPELLNKMPKKYFSEDD